MEEEIIDFPDVYSLFVHYNELYFDSSLGAVSVEWSKKMTLCAGLCEYSSMGGCRIKLSEPLLKYRPVADMKNTLLHEMIHAYLFLSKGNKDREDHGPNFLSKAHHINSAVVTDFHRPVEGYEITVYHSFHDEVDHYRTHIWSCARCSKLIKRSMNRAPSHKDCRFYRKDPAQQVRCSDPFCQWYQHEAICGGAFVKIAEPESKDGARRGKREASDTAAHNKRKRIDSYFVSTSSSSSTSTSSSSAQGDSSSSAAGASVTTPSETNVSKDSAIGIVYCPICRTALPEDPTMINEHVDACLDPDRFLRDHAAVVAAAQREDAADFQEVASLKVKQEEGSERKGDG